MKKQQGKNRGRMYRSTQRSGLTDIRSKAQPKPAALIWERMPAHTYSHIELSQQLVDRQQAGNILDNNFPSSFNGSVVGICPLSFAFPPPWFLYNKLQHVTGEEDSRLLGPGKKALGSGIMQAAPKPAFQNALCYPGKHPWHAQENKHLHL